MEKTHIEIDNNILGKECVLYMQPYDNLPPRTTATAPPAVRLAEGLADNHRDRLLAVPRDCRLNIKFVCGKRKIGAVWTVWDGFEHLNVYCVFFLLFEGYMIELFLYIFNNSKDITSIVN